MKKKQKSSLKNRALSQTAVLIIVTMCIMVTVFYMVFHSRAFNERGKYEEENLVNMEAYLNSYLEEVDSIAKNVNYNYYLQDYLETVIKEEDDYVDSGIGKNMRSYEMSSQAFSDTLLSRADISSIMIFWKEKNAPEQIYVYLSEGRIGLFQAGLVCEGSGKATGCNYHRT